MFTVFQMEDTEINVILTQHLDDFLGLYYDISDMDRLMILTSYSRNWKELLHINIIYYLVYIYLVYYTRNT